MGTIFQVNESNGNTTITGTLTMSSQQIHSVADPTSAQDAATKNYVDGLANGVSWKNPVLAATTGTLVTSFPGGYTATTTTLTENTPSDGSFTPLDGVTLVVGSRVLVKDETAGNTKNNGIYTVTTLGNGSSVAWVLTRSSDMNTWAAVPAAATIIEEGTINADRAYVCTSDPGGTLGTTAITFVLFASISGGVTSITGTTNQIIASSATGAVTLSTPQDIALSSSPTFASESLTNTTNQLVLGTTRTVTLTAPTPASASRTVTIPDLSGDYSVIGTIGTQTIGGSKTFSSAVTITPASNQLVLGTTNTATISATAPSASRTYTIADPGASASFVMTEGTQTINGSKTFGSAISAPAATLSNIINQLVLGTTNTTTISSTAPSASRTYTIPDAGTAANMVLDQGNYTIAGTWTFSNAITITPTTNQLVLGITRTVTITAPTPATSSRTWTIPDLATSPTFAALEGTQTFSGSKTFSSTLTLSPTTNQLVLGVTNTTTISSTAPSASRTYTIPDAGAASNFVLDKGNYTIGGTWTFSNSITLASSKSLVLTDNTTNTVSVKATNSTTTYTLSLPTTGGTNGYFLQTDGSGNTSWQPSTGSGTVNTGTAGQLAYYATSTNAVSGFSTSIAQLFSYRRPNLVYNSGTQVSPETGLDGVSGDATILFPDGTFRTETSGTRLGMVTTQNAVWTDATRGNNQGGLDTGSVGNNNWYAVYAVKVTTFSTDLVIVASLNLPLQANYSTLNSNFGTNGWVYLGLIRYGDQTGNNVILRFVQAGNLTLFGNTANGQVRSAAGVLLADSSGTTTLTYTYASGTGNTNIPNNIEFATFTGSKNSGAAGNEVDFHEAAGNQYFGTLPANGDSLVYRWTSLAFQGAQVVGNAGGGACSIWISGFTDNALGIGPNPLL